jgi:hypothetical protein
VAGRRNTTPGHWKGYAMFNAQYYNDKLLGLLEKNKIKEAKEVANQLTEEQKNAIGEVENVVSEAAMVLHIILRPDLYILTDDGQVQLTEKGSEEAKKLNPERN